MNYARKEARHKVQANDETYIAVGAFIFSHDEFIRGAVVARFHRARRNIFRKLRVSPFFRLSCREMEKVARSPFQRVIRGLRLQRKTISAQLRPTRR
jgi:hypothetical protein